jgi:hypothetical protein
MSDAADPPVQSSLPVLPPAHEAIRYWFNEKRGRRTGLARLLGLTAATVSSWGREENPSRPHEPFYLFAVQELAGIPVHAWLTPAELAALEPVLQNFQPLVVTHRRPKDDPRQLTIDDALSRLAHEPPSFDPDDDPLDGPPQAATNGEAVFNVEDL